MVYKGKVGIGFGGVLIDELVVKMVVFVVDKFVVDVLCIVVCGVLWIKFRLVVEIVFVEFIVEGCVCYVSFFGLCVDKLVWKVKFEKVVLVFEFEVF